MSQEINQFNLSSGLLNKYKNLLYYNSHWHQITVENVEGLDRDAVLRTLSKFCRPFDFIPVRYEAAKNSASFLLKNCGHAIEKLCNQSLVIANPHNPDKPFKLCVKLCHSHTNDLKINIHINVVNVLNKRFNAETGVLNLENFVRDQELEEYCTLSQPKLCFYILHLTKGIHFKTLKLSNNEIDSLKPLEALEGCKQNIILDLRNNNIKDITEFDNLQHLNIIELFLDGNPICDKFTEVDYGKTLKNKLEKLEKLDGVNIQMKGFMPFRRNYLCNLSGYDLVDQFLDHYFTQYDARNRTILDGMYHKDAMFSINSMYLPMQTTSQKAKLSVYKKYARNLRQISDFSKTLHSLFRGPYEILKVLNSLPVTEHDPFSFTVDLVMYTETSAMIVVCGVYRESAESLLETDRLLGFTRTFVLLAGSNGEYSIINEMLHVTNATTIQAARAFKQVRLPKPQFIYIPPAQNDKDKSDLADALAAITGLKTEWAHKCLAECNYEMKGALTLFIELFKVDKIPKSALNSKENVQNEQQPQSQPTDTSNAYGYTENFQTTPVPPTNIPSPMNITTHTIANNFSQYGSGKENVQSSTVTSVSNMLSSMMTTQKATSNLTQIHLQSIYATKELYKEKKKEVDERIPSANPSSSKSPAKVDVRSLSPDLLWDNFNSSKTKEDVIDINSSPELGTSRDVGATETKEDLKNFIPLDSIVYENGKSKKKKKKKKSGKDNNCFMEKFEQFKASYDITTSRTALTAALDLLAKSSQWRENETVFEHFYTTSPKEGRLLKDSAIAMSKNPNSRSMSADMIELLGAKMECIFGTSDVGENTFRRIMKERPYWVRAIVEFCKALIVSNNLPAARTLLKAYSKKNHALRIKIAKDITPLEEAFNIKLW